MGATVCPRCGGEMQERPVGQVSVLRCGSCSGVFLDRADLGRLIEDENDWHAHSSTEFSKAPAPKISTKRRTLQ